MSAPAAVRAHAPAAQPRALDVRWLGRVDYAKAWTLQDELRAERGAGRIPDTVLLLEHPDVITFGRGARPGSARHSDAEYRRLGFDVQRVNRGGDVTWHGPGQLVGYGLLDLAERERDVHVYLRQLEDVLIGVLAEFGIAGIRRDGYAGVWIDERRKIASIGVGVRRWLTLHGFALNVCCDLSRFDAIVPCGLAGVQMVSLSSLLGEPVALEPVVRACERHLERVFA